MRINLLKKIKLSLTLCLFSFLIISPLASYANTSDWGLVQRFTKQHALANQGNVKAMYDTGKLYERGRGVDKNMGKAAGWFQKAAEQGHASAQARLGILYFEGRGVKKNRKKAVRLLKKAAKSNIASAQFQLANMYELGAAVSKNLSTAISWYKKAEKNGYYLAKAKAHNLQQLLNAIRNKGSDTIKSNIVVTKKLTQQKTKSPAALLDIIRSGRWQKRKKPVGYLPSPITTCANRTYNSIHCISTSQERDTGAEIVTYNTESTVITKNKVDFQIIYTNNVLEVSTYAAQDGDGVTVAVADTRIKTGKKGKKRTLNCKFKNNNLLTCSKKNGSPFDLIAR